MFIQPPSGWRLLLRAGHRRVAGTGQAGWSLVMIHGSGNRSKVQCIEAKLLANLPTSVSNLRARSASLRIPAAKSANGIALSNVSEATRATARAAANQSCDAFGADYAERDELPKERTLVVIVRWPLTLDVLSTLGISLSSLAHACLHAWLRAGSPSLHQSRAQPAAASVFGFWSPYFTLTGRRSPSGGRRRRRKSWGRTRRSHTRNRQKGRPPLACAPNIATSCRTSERHGLHA